MDESKLVWDRPEPPQRPSPTPLSRDMIVQAAIRLADADGMEAVSLRKVAADLNAGPMRLYGYMSTKDELLDLMVDAVFGEIPLTDPGLPWRASLTSLAHGIRTAVLRHEWLADLLGGRPNLGPHTLAYVEASLAALYASFGDIDTAMHVSSTVNAYVVGAVKAEITDLHVERISGRTEQQWQTWAGPYLSRLIATGEFPTLAKVVEDATHPDADTLFDIGLGYVLDGIATRVNSG
ncbi:TetR/AcrR family transcriptional regulator C-terminal domain-containing protein [Actinocrispum wychmicini]|uniref:TetR/AcrR family transcriptional regulator C-terminal domain-containing protein n=1 Tax=Actinocrispum wychmicini TaxID=1213861 RepID=UPI001FB62513|nr:TetR/AcrR family transcriptional regulator C-terminal domain-containing protein [Actinocrispum wychmicini]